MADISAWLLGCGRLAADQLPASQEMDNLAGWRLPVAVPDAAGLGMAFDITITDDADAQLRALPVREQRIF